MPPSVRSLNQAAPFWDFVASLQDQAASHPFFSADPNQPREACSEDPTHPWGPQAWGHGGRRGGHGPGRGGRGRQHGHHHHLPPPPHGHGPHPPSPSHGPPGHEHGSEAANEGESSNQFDLPIRGSGSPPPLSHRAGPPSSPHHRRHGHHQGGSRSRSRSRSPSRRGRPAHHRGGHHSGHHDRRGCPEGLRGMGGPFGMGDLADFFQSQIFGDRSAEKKATPNEDFTPPADVFDTETAYVIHVSLAGAKKEDIAVSWDAENSELIVSGVIYRPGDEEFLKTLALDERNIGAFERKVKLGSRANPAKVEVTGIAAKMEDGVLRVHVPKEDKDDFINIMKVDIE